MMIDDGLWHLGLPWFTRAPELEVPDSSKQGLCLRHKDADGLVKASTVI